MKKLIVFLILILLGFAGWFLWDNSKDAPAESAKIEQVYTVKDH